MCEDVLQGRHELGRRLGASTRDQSSETGGHGAECRQVGFVARVEQVVEIICRSSRLGLSVHHGFLPLAYRRSSR